MTVWLFIHFLTKQDEALFVEMNAYFHKCYLALTVYLSITITLGVAAVINDVTDYDDLDLDPSRESTLDAYAKRDRTIDKITDPFRIGRELYARELQDLMLSLPKDSPHYGLIEPAINSLSTRDRASYLLKKPMSKRQRITVPQLAQLLNSMKTRNVDDEGVKLQTLRFGK